MDGVLSEKTVPLPSGIASPSRAITVDPETIESIAGVTINLGPSTDGAAREAELERLKTWWKEERFTRLTTELETVLKP